MARKPRDAVALFEAALTLDERGQSKAAFKLYLQAAELGDAGSQHNLGYLYDVGRGTHRDVAKAFYWYKRALKSKGDSGTSSNIAILYADIGNRRRAIHWWEKAIKEGDGDAALDLAKFFIASKHRKSMRQAMKLLKLAAASNCITPDGAEEAAALLRRMRGSKKTLNR